MKGVALRDKTPGLISLILEENILRRAIRLLLTVVIVLAVVIGFRWYRYVTNAESPYDEVGIELNSRMPGPINKWGCVTLHATFGGALPPYGCQDSADARKWR